MTSLARCPFCGNVPKIVKKEAGYMIVCAPLEWKRGTPAHWCQIFKATQSEAVQFWNESLNSNQKKTDTI